MIIGDVDRILFKVILNTICTFFYNFLTSYLLHLARTWTVPQLDIAKEVLHSLYILTIYIVTNTDIFCLLTHSVTDSPSFVVRIAESKLVQLVNSMIEFMMTSRL